MDRLHRREARYCVVFLPLITLLFSPPFGPLSYFHVKQAHVHVYVYMYIYIHVLFVLKAKFHI